MGFSTIGATVILFAGLLLFSSVIANSLFEAQRETSGALDESRDRAEFARGVAMGVSGNHAGGNLHLNVTNSGTVTLDAGLVHIIVDGSWDTSTITVSTIGGTSTDVWAPGETLYLRTTQAAEPSRVLVVAETGKTVAWTS